MKMPAYMESNKDQNYVDDLLSADEQARLAAVTNIKNMVIGNGSKKNLYITLGTVPRLVQGLSRDNASVEFVVEAIVILGSFARAGSKDIFNALLQCHTLEVLLKGICHSNSQIIEASVRSLRTLYLSPLTPCDPLYENPSVIPRLVELLSGSYTEAECAATVLAKCCQNASQQALICNSGAIEELLPLLTCDISKVQLPALMCCTALSYQNEPVSLSMKAASYHGQDLVQLLSHLLSRNNPDDVQLAAAKCLTNMFRVGSFSSADNHPLLLKILGTTVRMCRKDKPLPIRAEGGETLAYLIEEDTELQRLAAISDHLIKTLVGFLHRDDLDDDSYAAMRESSFKALASLGANDEDIRKRIIELESTMDHVVTGLEDPNPHVQLAAVKCLHSLSRSVQQLRTSLQDTVVWKPIMKLMHNASEGMLTVASSALCNLLLEFSPSKEVRELHCMPILEAGAVSLLADLTSRPQSALRLNGIWALMNMAYQADEVTKSKILEVLGPTQLFRLLEDPDHHVIMKSLGLMRNLLSGREDIDRIMTLHGGQIMDSVKPILDSQSHSVDVKEQALCVLANIANGTSAKDFLTRDESLLKRLMHYMMHDSVKLQMAATYCISNLVWNTEEGATDRQSKLRDMGVQKLLQSLLTTTDAHLFERVKTALQQFT